MNIRQLEAFKAAMELGSFTRAAESMHLSQPAVSKLIHLLEDACGFPLFHRQKNGVSPTAEAEMLYAEVERVFLNVDSVADRARAIREFDYGQLEIVAFPSLCARVLPGLLAEFLADHPGLDVRLSARNSRMLADRVATQGVDIGFGLIAPERPGVKFEKICSINVVCVMPPDHRLADRDVINVTDLEGERFISLLEEDHYQLQQIDSAFRAHGVSRNIVLKSQLTQACCAFAAAGAGVALVDPMSTAGFAPSDLAIKPFRPRIVFDIWVVTPTYRPLPRQAHKLVVFVAEQLNARYGAGATP